jgi:probable HAF family extracellular repeat protein
MPRLRVSEGLLTTLFILSVPASSTTFDYTTISVPGFAGPEARGINNAGQIVGFGGAGEVSKGFILSGDVVTTIFRSGSSGTELFGINNKTQFVGTYFGGMRPGHNALAGVVGALHPVLVPGADSTPEANGINNLGQIVGDSVTGGVTSGFLDDAGKFTTLFYPGSSGTEASGINDHGAIVGTYTDSAGGQHAYVYKDGVYTAIQIPGATGDSHATRINLRPDCRVL